MTRETLRALIEDRMQAERLLQQIKDRHRCGSSGSDLEPALNRVLDSILHLKQKDP
jgi:hypothetical protein